ncbi:MAG: hypothetical protein Q4D26_06810 [Clostridia bacterium]|nr:hypothetical protein [Clostridia bacterium]
MNTAKKRIEYMCVYCGQRQVRAKDAGRPLPGICPRKSNGRPHSWRRNREI